HGEEKQLQLCDVDELGVGELVTLKHVGNARKGDAAVAVEDALTIAVDLGWPLFESPGRSLHQLGLAFRLLAFFVGVQKWRTHKGCSTDSQQCPDLPVDPDGQRLSNRPAVDALEGQDEEAQNDQPGPYYELKARQTHQLALID